MLKCKYCGSEGKLVKKDGFWTAFCPVHEHCYVGMMGNEFIKHRDKDIVVKTWNILMGDNDDCDSK